MKHYKLLAWPDLPAVFQRTGYRRALHRMSQRYSSVTQLMQESGLARTEVDDLLERLSTRRLLKEREIGGVDSRFGHLSPMAWLRRTFSTEERR